MPIVPTGRDEIVFLKDIKPLPAFPVLWLDEGADIDQVYNVRVKKELSYHQSEFEYYFEKIQNLCY